MTPQLRDAINALLPDECSLPWVADDGGNPERAGYIFSKHGLPIASVDPWRDLEFPDEAAVAVAQAIVLAVNTAAGYDTKGNTDAL